MLPGIRNHSKRLRCPCGGLHGDPCGSVASLGCILHQDSLGYRVITSLKKKTNKPINKSRIEYLHFTPRPSWAQATLSWAPVKLVTLLWREMAKNRELVQNLHKRAEGGGSPCPSCLLSWAVSSWVKFRVPASKYTQRYSQVIMRVSRPSPNTYLYWSIITPDVPGSGRRRWLSPSLWV